MSVMVGGFRGEILNEILTLILLMEEILLTSCGWYLYPVIYTVVKVDGATPKRWLSKGS